MKVYFNQAERQLLNFANLLFLGPENTKKIDLTETLKKQWTEKLGEALDVVRMSANDALKDPLRLRETLEAQSLLGGNNLVILEGVTDKFFKIFEPLLKRTSNHKCILLAEKLAPSSKLRSNLEKHKAAAVIGCYADSFEDIQKDLKNRCRMHRLELKEDGEAILLSSLGDDYLFRKTVLNRLFEETPEGTTIDAAYAKRYAGTTEAFKVDELLYRIHNLSPLTLRMLENHINEEPHALLRMMERHFLKLFHVLKESSIERGLQSLSPPIMFMFQKAFKEQLGFFSLETVEMILARLQSLEAESRMGTENVRLIGPAILTLLHQVQEQHLEAHERVTHS